MAYIFILQNISANLGGMLTPFGNPQNLYLYSYFSIPTGEFYRHHAAAVLPRRGDADGLLLRCCPPSGSRSTATFPSAAEPAARRSTLRCLHSPS